MVAVADRSNQPIFPQWKTPYEWPWVITTMVSEARRILSYYELPDDHRPPKSIWHSAEKCSDFIEHSYKQMAGGGSGSGRLELEDSELM